MNGQNAEASLSMPATGSWDLWDSAKAVAKLHAGENTIEALSIGSSGANVDSITITNTTEIAAVTYEAEDAALTGAVVASDHTGYTGSGFVDYLHAVGDSIEWTVQADHSGDYLLTFRYALDDSSTPFNHENRPLSLEIGGQMVESSINFTRTGSGGSWTTWAEVEYAATLAQGENKIRLAATGESGANVDHLRVQALDRGYTGSTGTGGGALPTVGFTKTTAKALEGEDLVLEVSLSKASDVEVRVRYQTADISATGSALSAGQDYVGLWKIITFAPGELTKKIQIKTFDDTRSEPDEYFQVYLQQPWNAVLGRGIATGIITEKAVGITGDKIAVEDGSDAVTLTFVRFNDVPKTPEVMPALKVHFEINWLYNGESSPASAADFDPADFAKLHLGEGGRYDYQGEVEIPAGQRILSVPLHLIADHQREGRAGKGGVEGFTVTIVALSGDAYMAVPREFWVDVEAPTYKELRAIPGVFEINGEITYQILDGVTLYASSNEEPSLADAGATGIDVNDVKQGSIGDCFLQMAVMSLARSSPQTLERMMTENADGSFDVKLFQVTVSVVNDSEVLVVGPQVTVRVDNPLNRNAMVQLSGDFDAATGKMEIWTAVLEQAYAKLVGGYAVISAGGDIQFAWATLTGTTATQTPIAGKTSAQVLTAIQTALASGAPVVLTNIAANRWLPEKHGCSVDRVVGQTVFAKDPNDNLHEIAIPLDDVATKFYTYVVFPLIP